MTDKIVLFTTVASPEEADRLARALVDRRLAACVTILPQARSVYRWQGRVEESTELLLLIKSRRPLFAALSEAVRALHSYEIPELIALPVVDGNPPYLDWIDHETEVL
jgi:periplasmic divalent cation tolerance protein